MASVDPAVIEGMEWSYTRITSFHDCKYKWYLKYIVDPGGERVDLFFSDYGKFVHSLLAEFFSGQKTRSQIEVEYLLKFQKVVNGHAPSTKIYSGYFQNGLDYIRQATIPVAEVVDVEKKYHFEIGPYKFVGIIDLLGKDEDGNFIILDNKSRNILPRVAKKKPTKRNRELKEHLRQLYVYSTPIFDEYKVFPTRLQFNCFRFSRIVDEPFVNKDYDETVEWVKQSIEEIKNEEEFAPDYSYFKCNFLCDMKDQCEYYKLNHQK